MNSLNLKDIERLVWFISLNYDGILRFRELLASKGIERTPKELIKLQKQYKNDVNEYMKALPDDE